MLLIATVVAALSVIATVVALLLIATVVAALSVIATVVAAENDNFVRYEAIVLKL